MAQVAVWQAEALLARKPSAGSAVDGHPRGTALFLVRWAGYGDEHNSWEPEESLPRALVSRYLWGDERISFRTA